MATGGSAQFNLGIKTTADLSGINQVKQSLKEIYDMSKNASGLGFTTNEVYDIQRAVTSLDTALTQAYNPNINTVNIDKFNKVLAVSGLSLQDIQASMALVGVEGQNAFFKATSQLFRMNGTLKQSHVFLDKIAKTIGNTVRYQLINMAIQKIIGSISEAYGYVKNLDSSLNNIQIITEKSANSMKEFAKQANSAAQSLGAQTTDYTDASLIYYQQGQLLNFVVGTKKYLLVG